MNASHLPHSDLLPHVEDYCLEGIIDLVYFECFQSTTSASLDLQDGDAYVLYPFLLAPPCPSWEIRLLTTETL